MKRLGIALALLMVAAAVAFVALRRPKIELRPLPVGPDVSFSAVPSASAKVEPPLDIGPSTSERREERASQAFDLLTGNIEASRLPVLAAEPSRTFDYALVERLAPKAPSPPRGPCTCAPGDPLCDCP